MCVERRLQAVVRAGPTPGPWIYQERSDAYTHIVRQGDSNRFLCQFAHGTSGQAEADARLAAAAPDLLSACQSVVGVLDRLLGDSDLPYDERPGVLVLQNVVRAIEKATGAVNL